VMDANLSAAKAAGVGLSRVKVFEGDRRTPIASTLAAMRVAPERAGIGFPFVVEDGVKKACRITSSEPEKGKGH